MLLIGGPSPGHRRRYLGSPPSVVAAVELRFSNGMSTTPWYLIDGLTTDDVEVVAAEISGGADGVWQAAGGEQTCVDGEALRDLERAASCKLSKGEALLLRQNKICCPICLDRFASNHTILCLPCGRPASNPAAFLKDDVDTFWT